MTVFRHASLYSSTVSLVPMSSLVIPNSFRPCVSHPALRSTRCPFRV